MFFFSSGTSQYNHSFYLNMFSGSSRLLTYRKKRMLHSSFIFKKQRSRVRFPSLTFFLVGNFFENVFRSKKFSTISCKKSSSLFTELSYSQSVIYFLSDGFFFKKHIYDDVAFISPLTLSSINYPYKCCSCEETGL